MNNFFFRFRMRNEFTQKQHQTELLKRHAFNQKQFPKNIKV